MSNTLLQRSTKLYKSLNKTTQLRTINNINLYTTPYNTPIKRQFATHHEHNHHARYNSIDDVHFHPPTDMFNKYAGTVLASIMWFWLFINWYENWDVFFGLRHPWEHRGEHHDDHDDSKEHH